MVSRKNDKPWKAKTWDDVVCVDVKYRDRERSMPEVCIWRRTPAGKSMIVDKDVFPSYFYIPKADEWRIANMDAYLIPTTYEYPAHKAIDGTELVRLNYDRLTKMQFKAARGYFEKTYEADIKYRTRYHIDNNINFAHERRICFFDLETDMSLDTENTPAPILSISTYDTKSKEEIEFIWDPKLKTRNKIEDRQGYSIFWFNNEVEMLNTFIAYIQKYNPDILCAYNLVEFDWPYLINRMKALGIPYRKLSELEDVYAIVDPLDNERNVYHCGGRELLDWYVLVKKLYDEDKPDTYKLDDVAHKILGKTKVKHKYNSLRDLYKNDIELFIQYNLEDVRLIRDLENKTGLITKYLVALQQLVPIPMELMKDNSVVVDSYILKSFNGQHIFPSKLNEVVKDDGKSKYTGAITGRFVEDKKGNITSTDPMKKMYNNVGVFDFAGLYPNIVRTFNISPETICIPGEPDSVTIDGVAFTQIGKGIFPTLIDNVIKLRATYQKKLEGLAPTDLEYNIYFNLATAVKKLNNSIYGVSGYPKFRLYNINVAKSITAFGQLMIKEVFKELEHVLKYTTIYFDTDSCFFEVKCNVTDQVAFEKELEFLEKHINNKVQEIVDSYGVNHNYLKMEFEKRFTKLIFFGVKKRYIGVSDFWKGSWLAKHKVVIKGYDLVRSEMPGPIKEVIRKIIMMFLNGVDKESIRKYYKESVQWIRSLPVQEIAWSKGIGKSISEYTKVVPQHIKACMVAEQVLGIKFGKNDRPKIMYVKKVSYEHEGITKTSDVIAFEKDTILPPSIMKKIDYDRVIDSFIINKLDDFIGVEGMEMDYVLNGKKVSLNDFFGVDAQIKELQEKTNRLTELEMEIVEDE